jgi:hypothetical protein
MSKNYDGWQNALTVLAFGPLIHVYFAFVEVVSRHFDRLGYLLYTPAPCAWLRPIFAP